MSSNRRGEVFQNRWNQAAIRKVKKFTNWEKLAYLNRAIARMNKGAGYTTDKQPFVWSYSGLGKSGQVSAFTRSEARSKIKHEAGIPRSKRLPQNVVIEKGERCQTLVQ